MLKNYEKYEFHPKSPGWFCIGFKRMDNSLQQDIGPNMQGIYKFDEKKWFTEEGDEITSIYDPEIGWRVSIGAADYYIPQ